LTFSPSVVLPDADPDSRFDDAIAHAVAAFDVRHAEVDFETGDNRAELPVVTGLAPAPFDRIPLMVWGVVEKNTVAGSEKSSRFQP
jgi:hypothetical protein